MRGAPVRGQLAVGGRRIIPADAGSTATGSRTGRNAGDHPRGCGEHIVLASSSVFGSGSSPRMRGAHFFNISYKRQRRIIPADAGSTEDVALQRGSCGDHPRGCGEHDVGDICLSWFRGSSPRMRGALMTAADPQPCRRIIPADAGSTISMLIIVSRHWDHPRGCGEHRRRSRICATRRGSSPRMRGAPADYQQRSNCIGIIPADAGST